MKISEIFTSIEGEGIWIGIPTNFIRTYGCSIKCRNCDTVYSWYGKYKDMTIDEILTKLNENIKRVSITGGEPLDQDRGELFKLICELKNQGYTPINLETSGQKFDYFIACIVDTVSLDLKTPSTGVTPDLDILESWIRLKGDNAQIKTICQDKRDLNFIIKKYTKLYERTRFNNFVITPSWYSKNPIDFEFVRHVIEKVKEVSFPIRVIIQQHKIIYGVERRGV